MKLNLKKLLALLLVVVMVSALFVGCQNDPAATDPTESTPADTSDTADTGETPTEPAANIPNTLVVATADFSQKFTPFFYTTVYDGYIGSALTQVGLLGVDREGNPVLNGIEGETRSYNGKDYTYYGIANCEVIENDDGTVDYKITIRDDIKFSDGEPLTMKDVLFSIYMICDPTYDGSSTFYALPIEGMAEYRAGMDTRGNVIFADGPDGYVANDLYTEDQYNTFWDYYNNNAGADFAQEIIDYCCTKYIGYAESYIGATAEEVAADEGLQVKLGMFLWGFGDFWTEGATAADYWNAIVEAYEGDIANAEATESAGSTLLQLTLANAGSEFQAGVKTGEGASNISGITVPSDTELNIHMTEVDATAIYHVGLTVAPLHYYGDPALFDADNDMFGFNKGDMSLAKAKSTVPLGAGPYTFVEYANGQVTMQANPNYYKGEPKTEYIVFKETSSADMLTGISTGDFDLTADASYNTTAAAIIKDYNSNGEVTGDVYTTISIDNLGYGYIGINASLVNVDGDISSEASKNLRKAYATLFAVYRETVIGSYYGELAQVINYPISNTSWAAPRPADDGYEIAFSKDVDGNPIYTDGMTEEEKYAAALEAAKGFFEAAGFTLGDENTPSDVPEFEVTIPADGTGDHPAYKILTEVSSALETIGVKLTIRDVSDGNILWDGLDANTIPMWAAAWGAAVDPDMYQVYHSDNVTGSGTGSNHYYIQDAELDRLIMAARTSVDQSYRKATYKECLDIILDWACEIPTYQRQNATLVSTERVNLDTITPDITPFWDWMNDIEKIEMNPVEG